MDTEQALTDDVDPKSPLTLYLEAFDDVDTRAMLQAGAEVEAIDALLDRAVKRGTPATESEIDAICPRERPVYADDEDD